MVNNLMVNGEWQIFGAKVVKILRGEFLFSAKHFDKWHFGDPPSGTSFATEQHFDSRGDPAFDAAFVFGVGKSVKSSKLNIPVNAFFIPRRDGHRFGISMGFNAKQ